MMRVLSQLLIVAVLALLPAAACAEDGFSEELERRMALQDEQAERGDFEKMLQDARAGARSSEPDAWYLLGRALGNVALNKKRAGDTKGFTEAIAEAREAFETAKELGGLLYEPAFLGLARCSRFEGDLERAERDLRQALRVAPAFKPAALELAQVLWERGLYADAELELHRLLEKRPDDIDARMLLGSLKVTRKRWGDAELEFRTVVTQDPDNVPARKLLGTALMFQEKLEEAAEHWEVVRVAAPKDDEAYITLFQIYKGMEDEEKARVVLNALIQELPDSEAANRARNTLQQMDEDPTFFTGRVIDEKSPERLVERVEKGNEEERVKALHDMRDYEWKALPGVVYKMLSPKDATPPVRRAALQLIGTHGDPRTVPLLEILLFHPKERDPNMDVRRAAADALSVIASDAAVPMLYKLLDDPDVDTREAGVRGLAARTGKWIRADLDVVTPVTEWPAEREGYETWWTSGSGGIAKRRAMEAMVDVFAHLRRGRARLAEYALFGLEDENARTWSAGYALFRALTGETFGSESGFVDETERRRIATEARRWVESHRDEEG
jgi:tetratricopeptide (TPR) repeat protein